MAETKHKYRITALLESLPRTTLMRDVVKQLSKLHIPERTFYRDKNILAKQTAEIPAGRLRKYASFFGVTLDEMFSTETAKVKSIHETSAKIKTGLGK